MIKISDGKIYVDGEPTTNPELIGLAVLDSLETQRQSKELLKAKYYEYIQEKGLRNTPERKLILDLILEKREFADIPELKKAFDKNRPFVIYLATFYNTVDLLIEFGILQKHPQRFVLADDLMNQLN